MDVNDQNELDLDFFADDEDTDSQEGQDESKVTVDKDEYERLKQQQEAQQRQAEEAANAQQQHQKKASETPELDAYTEQRFEQLMKDREAQIEERVQGNFIADTLSAENPDIAHDDAAAAWIISKIRVLSTEATRRGESFSRLDIGRKAVQEYRKLTGQHSKNQDTSRNYSMMNPDVRGQGQQPPQKKITAEKIAEMPMDKFEELDAKVSRQLAAGKQVSF